MPRDNRVDSRERDVVLRRDSQCFVFRIDHSHVCRGAFGQQHSPFDIERLTLDHFHLRPGGVKGKKAKSDRWHMVAMCHTANIGAPSREIREKEREYMMGLPGWSRCECCFDDS